MQHQVDIFQHQLQYEALAVATTTLMLASHLQRDERDTPQSLKLLTPEDMAQMNILPGHRRLMVEILKDL